MANSNGSAPVLVIGDRSIPMHAVRMGAARQSGLFEKLEIVKSMHNPPTTTEVDALIVVVHSAISDSIGAPEFAALMDRLSIRDGLQTLSRAVPDVMRLAGFAFKEPDSAGASPGEAASPSISTSTGSTV